MITAGAWRLYRNEPDPFGRAAADVCELAGIKAVGALSALEMLIAGDGDARLDRMIRDRVPTEWSDDFETAWCMIEAARDMERACGWLK